MRLLKIGLPILLLLFKAASGQTKTQDTSLLYRVMPANVKVQFAGNIGLVSAGIGYVSPNKRWKGDAFYGFVPRRYSGIEPIHSLTLKGKFGSILRTYSNAITVQWLQTGLWFNYALNEDFFFTLPSYYEPNYYLIRPGFNIGGFLGSEIRRKKWGLYYEVGTTDKYLIHYVKNFKAVAFNHIVSAGIGVVYHLKSE